MNIRWITAGLLGVYLAIPAPAAETEPPEERQAAKLAQRFGAKQEEVQALRDKGMGWGEIKHALAISRKADVPVSDVVKMRESGAGWGRIAQQYGFKLGEATGGRDAAVEQPRQEPPRDAMRGTGREKGRPGGNRGRGRRK